MHRIFRINEGPIAVDDQARIMLRKAPFKTDAADDRSSTDLSAANDLRAGRKSGPNSRQDLVRPADANKEPSATQGSIRAHARQKQLPPAESGGALSFAVGDARVAERQGGVGRASPVPPCRPIALVIVSIFFAMGYAGSSLHLDHAGRFRLTDDVGIAARELATAPKASGHITTLPVKDRQLAAADDAIPCYDHRDYRPVLQHAEAKVASAEANSMTADAQIHFSPAQISASPAQVNQAPADLALARRQSARCQDPANRAAGAVQSAKHYDSPLHQREAALVAFLASNSSDDMTGQAIVTDGARRRRNPDMPTIGGP